MEELGIKNRKKFYWILQGTGWASFFVFYTWLAMFDYGWDRAIIVNYFFVALIGFLLSHLYRGFIKRRNWTELSVSNLVLLVPAASVIIGVVWGLLILPVSLWLGKENNLTALVFFDLIFSLTIIILIWSLIYFFIKLFTSYKKNEIEKWRLEAAVKDAQLIALKSQINPHFIFNSLNNIRSLVVEEPEKARDMITHLSGLLRYSLQFSNAERVPLREELGIIKTFLKLESIHYEDRLRYKFLVDEKALDRKIPPMAIQMLVENAIKHGISRLPDGGEVAIHCYLNNEDLVVEVLNSGQISPENPDKTGIGLKNATERLKLLFGKLAELTLENVDDNMVMAKFSIPLNTNTSL